MNATPHILVIDDEQYICESCNRILSDAGYRVDTNISATRGFRQALTNPYDAIVLDLNLVESDGMQLLYGIRKRKPYVPVVIITGYPSEETRQKSTTLGVTDYITKPFEPAEILEPIQRVTSAEEKTVPGSIPAKPHYRYHLSSWFCPQSNGSVMVGGYVPDLSNHTLKSVKLPEAGSYIYRGLPLAEATLSNGTRQIIPSSVTGKVIRVNRQISEHPYILEKNIHKKSWIALVEPEHPDEASLTGETRSILIFAGKSSEENELYKQFIHKGYITRITGDIKSTLKILSEGAFRVLVMDARNLSHKGPGFVKRINQEFQDVKVIVFNDPDIRLEKMYRENTIFYYGVNPVSNNEMVDLLHCAFSVDSKKIMMKNPRASRFLPSTISKISIINRYGRKVTLFAYNDILKNSEGLGYLLAKELLDMELPVKLNYSRSRKSMDNPEEIRDIAGEKEKNDRVIILRSKDLDRIPGSIVKETEGYQNQNTSDNLMVSIFVQPPDKSSGEAGYDENTTVVLKEIIKTEMTSL